MKLQFKAGHLEISGKMLQKRDSVNVTTLNRMTEGATEIAHPLTNKEGGHFKMVINDIDDLVELNLEELSVVREWSQQNNTEVREGVKYIFDAVGTFIAPKLTEWNNLALKLATETNTPIKDRLDAAVATAKQAWMEEMAEAARQERQKKEEIRRAVEEGMRSSRE